MNWCEYFLNICNVISTKSKDPTTKVGAVITGPHNEIRSTGYNGFPRGVFDSEERMSNREIKYRWTVHAEMNAILSAAHNGVSLEGCTLYTHWHPCHECAKAIIQAGITDIIVSGSFMKKRGITGWEKSFETANEMFFEAGISITIYNEDTQNFEYENEDTNPARR